jgi:hypothetical protein
MSRWRVAALFFTLPVLFLLTACHDDEGDLSTPETILTVEIEHGAYAGFASWVFATSDDGNVLDVKPITAADQIVTLSSVKRVSKIHVTFFKRFAIGTMGYSIFSTYAAIAKGTTVTLQAPQPSLPVMGVASFEISNYMEEWDTLNFSNSEGRKFKNAPLQNELSVDISLRQAPGDVLMAGYRSGVPVYSWARDVQGGDLVTRDFLNDFEPFPHQLKLDFEGANVGSVTGIDASNGAQTWLVNSVSLIGTQWGSAHPVIGYVDGFDAYETIVWNSKTTGLVEYHKIGKPNLSFSIPPVTCLIHNEHLSNFSFTLSQPHTYYNANWIYPDGEEYIAWDFTGPAGQSMKWPVVPDMIDAKYRGLDPDRFVLNFISFTQMIGGKWTTYPEAVPGIFRHSAKDEQEYYVYYP